MSKVDFILFLILVSLVILAIPKGLEKQAKVDCLKWKKWNQEYPLFQPSEEQVRFCKYRFGIDLR